MINSRHSFASPADHELTNHARLHHIQKEFKAGYELLEDLGRAVTYFGSAMAKRDSLHYKKARQLAKKVAEMGFTTVTGGGPGIMEAASRGGVEGGGRSVGFNIILKSKKERSNKYIKESVSFYYFFVRKVMLASAGNAYVFFPGGFGTLDEFFEISTLIHTHKLHKDVPAIMVGKQYWRPLMSWLEKVVVTKYGAFDRTAFDMWHLVDTSEEAFEIIRHCQGKNIC